MNTYTQRTLLLVTSALTLLLAPQLSSALPTGGSVSSGTATITNPTSSSTVVTQSTPSAVINWTGFNTTKGQQVTINDTKGSGSVTLNRVSGGATTFDGALSSNGNVWVINPSGVLIGSTGTVNTAGFLATTSNITDANFMSGKYNFTPGGGAATASVANQGTITVAETGLAALVAPNVANSGTINFTGNVINAKVGTIALASGDAFTVDLAGDGLINLAASSAVTQQSLSNTGTLNAIGATGGGTVAITAAEASKVLDSLINLGGLIEADNLKGAAQDASIDLEGVFKNPGKGTFSLSTSGTGSILLDNGSQIDASAPLNVTLNTTGSGSAVIFGAVNTAGGSFGVTVDNPVAGGLSGLVSLNNSSINTGGGAVTIFSNNQVYAFDGSIVNAGNVSSQGSGSDPINDGSNFHAGIWMDDYSISSPKGSVSLVGYAPSKTTGSTAGILIADQTDYTPEAPVISAGKEIDITGIASPTVGGASTGADLSTVYLQAPSIVIDGYKSNIVGSTVKGGDAEGVLMNGVYMSGVGGGPLSNLAITGQGGNAPGYSADGVNLGYVTVNLGTGSATINGTGGTGVSTIGVYGQGGLAVNDNNESPYLYQGKLTITGQGGNSSGGGVDAGVSLASPDAITNYIQVSQLNISGKGGTESNSPNGAGVYLQFSNLNADNIAITGNGASGSGSNNFGIDIAGGDYLAADKSIVLTGTGVGNAADITTAQALLDDETFSNYADLENGATLKTDGTRGKLQLDNLQIYQTTE